jgi:hypothetical protein
MLHLSAYTVILQDFASFHEPQSKYSVVQLVSHLKLLYMLKELPRTAHEKTKLPSDDILCQKINL